MLHTMNDIRIVTANVDFTLRPAQVKEDLERIIKRADIICFQEAKRVDLDRLIKDKDWEVYQPMANEATRGSAVAWRKSMAKEVREGRVIGTTPHGRGMLTRHIVWVKLRINGKILVVASCHLPPKRYWGLVYNIMLASIGTFIGGRKVPVLIGADWNKIVTRAADILALARRFNGQTRGVHIDGFLLVGRGKWKFVAPAISLFNTHSDHNPVQSKIA